MDKRELFIALCIAAVIGRAPLMLILMAAFDNCSTTLARYTWLGVAVVIGVGVDVVLLENYSIHEIVGLIREFNPVFAWAICLSLACADSVVAAPLVIRRIRRKPNMIAHTWFTRRRVKLMPDGMYVPSTY